MQYRWQELPIKHQGFNLGIPKFAKHLEETLSIHMYPKHSSVILKIGVEVVLSPRLIDFELQGTLEVIPWNHPTPTPILQPRKQKPRAIVICP